jgi:hypothetical protein
MTSCVMFTKRLDGVPPSKNSWLLMQEGNLQRPFPLGGKYGQTIE